MIPPTSIDGTDITGATIDGTDVQEITVDGDVVFSAGPRVVDDFETQNLNVWSGDTAAFSIDTSTVKVGTASVEYVSASDNQRIGTATGIDGVPQAGDRTRIWMKPGVNISGPEIYYASDSFSGRNDAYTLRVDPSSNQLRFFPFEGGTFTGIIQDASAAIDSDWHLLEIFHDTNGDYEHTLFDSNGTTQLAQMTGNDTTHITGGSFDNPNVQLVTEAGASHYWDHWVFVE